MRGVSSPRTPIACASRVMDKRSPLLKWVSHIDDGAEPPLAGKTVGIAWQGRYFAHMTGCFFGVLVLWIEDRGDL